MEDNTVLRPQQNQVRNFIYHIIESIRILKCYQIPFKAI